MLNTLAPKSRCVGRCFSHARDGKSFWLHQYNLTLKLEYGAGGYSAGVVQIVPCVRVHVSVSLIDRKTTTSFWSALPISNGKPAKGTSTGGPSWDALPW
jgi:hypothetical protein